MLRQRVPSPRRWLSSPEPFFPQPRPERRESVRRELTLRDRVRAQEAIERVYYGHQLGSVVPFERSVPRALAREEGPDLSEAIGGLGGVLEHAGHGRDVGPRACAHDARSRMSDRLREIFAALGDRSVRRRRVSCPGDARGSPHEGNFLRVRPQDHARGREGRRRKTCVLASSAAKSTPAPTIRAATSPTSRKTKVRIVTTLRRESRSWRRRPTPSRVRVTLQSDLCVDARRSLRSSRSWPGTTGGNCAERGLCRERRAGRGLGAFALLRRACSRKRSATKAIDGMTGFLDDLPACAVVRHTAIWTGSELLICWGGSGAQPAEHRRSLRPAHG